MFSPCRFRDILAKYSSVHQFNLSAHYCAVREMIFATLELKSCLEHARHDEGTVASETPQWSYVHQR